MPLAVDPNLSALFGSEIRVRTLAVLANSAGPSTGYRIAQVSGDERTKVYDVLRSLAGSGIVRSVRRRDGRESWSLADADLRRMLIRRVRLTGETEWDSGFASRVDRAREFVDAVGSINLRGLPSPSKETLRELRRSPAKDRALAAAGLAISRRLKR